VRVTRSFAFVDLAGFTAYTQHHGDQEAVAMLALFRATLRDICSRRAVRIAKWLGDGAMLVSVEPTPLLSAVLELRHCAAALPRPMGIRCGVTQGAVILLEGDDYIGHEVNVAARLCDVAGEREILATPAVAQHAPPWAKSGPAEGQPIRGLDQPVTVVRLSVRDAGPGAVSDPICGIPLSAEAALAADPSQDGERFCSESCLDTWLGRAG
jgi:class 3 adenylate cyclase